MKKHRHTIDITKMGLVAPTQQASQYNFGSNKPNGSAHMSYMSTEEDEIKDVETNLELHMDVWTEFTAITSNPLMTSKDKDLAAKGLTRFFNGEIR